ncbi:hypothetical protein HPB47_000807 [Ixodes persulcatus]|uniref:Uncharacterized protein n=1 Tax=Ixodes persulcatus TaxID=34615 RepID=A0AC60PQN6_IXOPE|nr:hypothetical protein HPB47_000807 [Ixodes persulcatus]
MEGQDLPRSPEPVSQEATSLTLPSVLDYTFKTTAETTPGALEQTMPGELEQTLCLDALNVGGTVDAKEQSSVCVQKQPEVDVLPEAMEGTDVCTAANEPQPQDFEAGPEVAQFSKKEILSFEASLKDPSDLDFLPKVASSGRLQKTHPRRRSTLLKFDPLLSELRPVYQSSGKYEPMFSENEMTQALKCQELVFQERLLIKDRDYMNEQYNLRQEVEAWRAKDSEEFEDLENNFQADIAVLRGQMKKAEVDKSSLETRLEQEKNSQLAKLHDDLLNQARSK